MTRNNNLHPFRSGIVSLIGKTNVGKSTLLNRFIGEKIAIISPKVQTSRYSIRGIKTTDQAQIIFIDTPGIFSKPRTKLDQKLTSRAREGLSKVDLILFMVTPFDALSEENASILKEANKGRTPLFLVINKIDLVQKNTLLPLIDQISSQFDFKEIYPISALRGSNVQELEEGIITYLPEGEMLYDPEIISTANLRFIVSEIIREKVYELTNQEIPYASAVKISQFVESDGLTKIEATIYVEKESQKGILIGNKGSMIKRLGTRARQDIERLLEMKVFLSLKVKVRKKWRSDEYFLKQLGL